MTSSSVASLKGLRRRRLAPSPGRPVQAGCGTRDSQPTLNGPAGLRIVVEQNTAHHGLPAVAAPRFSTRNRTRFRAFDGESLCLFLFLPQIRKLSARHRI